LMPAALAITIYLLSVPVRGKKFTHYLLWPVIWFISGTFSSILTYGLFIKITHYIIPFYNPVMHYGFLKFKLWPNEAFALGLIPGIILLSIPVIGLILAASLRKIQRMHWIRIFALLSILGIYFVGSTIVSIRAGGGFDLHNYDTFVLLLLIIGCYWGLGAVGSDLTELELAKPLLNNRFVLLGLLVVPVYFALMNIPARTNYSAQEANDSIQHLRMVLRDADTSKGPVLFIDYRHLLVFHMIDAESLFIPYEKIELMEMAMANNSAYRDGFWRAIENQEFSIIISEIHVDSYQDENKPFGYENNVWFEDVSYPILNNYVPIYLNHDLRLGVYIPTPLIDAESLFIPYEKIELMEMAMANNRPSGSILGFYKGTGIFYDCF